MQGSTKASVDPSEEAAWDGLSPLPSCGFLLSANPFVSPDRQTKSGGRRRAVRYKSKIRLIKQFNVCRVLEFSPFLSPIDNQEVARADHLGTGGMKLGFESSVRMKDCSKVSSYWSYFSLKENIVIAMKKIVLQLFMYLSEYDETVEYLDFWL